MSSVNPSSGGIPCIIHQIWVQGVRHMPRRYREAASTWARRNPGWTHRLWDEWSLRHHFIGDPWWPIYMAQPELVARADVARYALLQRFGGVYADVDTECRRPIQPLFSKGDARLYATLYSHPRWTRNRYKDATNSILASTPGHSLWSDVLAHLQRRDPRLAIPERTGPAMLSRLLEKHDAHLIRLPRAFTSALVPVPLMRAFSALNRQNCILDFNDSGRLGVRRALRAALGGGWRGFVVTMNGGH